MKHLKTYEAQQVSTIAKRFNKEWDKINLKLLEIKEYANDILTPLIQEGYEVNVEVCTVPGDNHLSVSIYNKKYFELDDIKDELIHLNNYFKSKGIDTQISNIIKWGSIKSIDRIDNETYEKYKSYKFFTRFYPKKVLELKAQINAIRYKS